MNHLGWLAAGIARQVAQKLKQYPRTGTPFVRFPEQDMVRCVQAVFDGLGYNTWLEWPHDWPHEQNGKRKADLHAESPIPHESDKGEANQQWVAEVKVAWEQHDNRFGKTRFDADAGEFRKDIAVLKDAKDTSFQPLLVWLIFYTEGAEVARGRARVSREEAITHMKENGVLSEGRSTLNIADYIEESSNLRALVWVGGL